MEYESERDEAKGDGEMSSRLLKTKMIGGRSWGKVSMVMVKAGLLVALISVRNVWESVSLLSSKYLEGSRDSSTVGTNTVYVRRRKQQEKAMREVASTWEELNNNLTTRLPPPAPPYAVSEQMRRQNCSIASQAQLKGRHEDWRKSSLPLLTGVILSPPRRDASMEEDLYHVFFNIRSMRKQRKDFLLKETEWSCVWSVHKTEIHGDRDLLVERGRLVGVEPGDPDGVTVILQCPQFADADDARAAPLRLVHLHHVGNLDSELHSLGDDNQTFTTEAVPAERKHLVTYNVALAARCAQDERAVDYVPEPPPKIAACPVIWGAAVLPHFRQWVAYHRLIGVQHFFVYIHQPWALEQMSHHLPSAPYITYRPFDIDGVQRKVGGGATEKNFYQPNQQTDCIYRARTFGAGGGVDWVAITDTDEYLQVMQPASKANAHMSELERILQPLQEDAQKGHFAGVLLRNWFWGDNRLDALHPETNTTQPLQHRDFLFDHVHRAPWHSRRWRTKNIVYAWNVRYYTMHQITEGLGIDRQNENASTTPDWFTQTSSELVLHPQHYILDAQRQMRISHFKEPAKGVYDYRGKLEGVQKVVKDEHLRNTYLQRIQQLLETMEYYD